MNPMPAKPSNISAHVAGSGTAAVGATSANVLPERNGSKLNAIPFPASKAIPPANEWKSPDTVIPVTLGTAAPGIGSKNTVAVSGLEVEEV